MRILGPRTLLPLTMFVGLAVIGMRATDIWNEAASGRLFARQAHAETAPEPAKPAAANAPASAPASPAAPPPAANAAKAAPAEKTAATNSEMTIPDDVTPAEMEVLKQLTNRREELDKRSQELNTREDLIKIAEQRVDQKIKDMETLRTQLQSMVNQLSETQAAQVDSLVKIYETMKPKDAAKIFEALDMPILLSVIQRMKPARTAPILAEMNPDKAKEVTTALLRQDKLPQTK